MSSFDNSKVLVTGACGTIGKELVQQVLDSSESSEVIALDNNETEMFFLKQRFQSYGKRFSGFLADLRDKNSLAERVAGVDVILHAAALKHVGICEESPSQAVQTNILGTQNLIEVARSSGVKKMIFTSSDKAVNPTNVMGASKLMGERLMTAANCNSDESQTLYASTRFGNVLGSNGSVIPIFKAQIESGGPITLTDERMTRFVMTVEQAVSLVLNSVDKASGGEVFVTKMPVMRIVDLAVALRSLLASSNGFDEDEIKIVQSGVKPGEKLFEELMTTEETRRTFELGDYFSVLPAFLTHEDIDKYEYSDLVSKTVNNPYLSDVEQNMSVSEIKEFLVNTGLV